ncbi:uncharacterized protein LOC131928188 [Physella acuta]|uniref:uncharacterized protein LOC131928188 n=1 Tax=Physella acuta TaxID=109671 RepID=UPI0027DB1D9B|nr:uncharacterized protein LOC131928188 [Physella acuta]
MTSLRPTSSHLSDSLSGEKGQGQAGPKNQKTGTPNGTPESQTNLNQQKQSLIDQLGSDRDRWKFYVLCLKLNRIHFVYDLCEHRLHHPILTKLVLVEAIKRNRAELIAYMLDQDIAILEEIDETFIVEKNKHICCVTNPKEIDTPYHYTTWKCVTCFLPKNNKCKAEHKTRHCKRPSGLKTKVYSWFTNVPRYRCSQENLNHRIQREIDKFDFSQECPHQTDGSSFSSDESNLDYLCHLANQLFKRAVRLRKTKLAEVLWRHVSYPISAALYACGVLKVLKMFENNADKQKKLRDSITTFEGLACDTINRTYTVYPEYIFDLLMGVVPEWGHTSCIYLAITNYNLSFVSTEPCLELNNRLWYWGTTDTDECMWHMDDDTDTQGTSEGQGRIGQVEPVKRFHEASHCRVSVSLCSTLK